jgi:GT2 family glycosyltransferase
MTKNHAVTITIPTTGRPERLRNCLRSIDYENARILIGAVKKGDVWLDEEESEKKNISIFYGPGHPVVIQNSLAALSHFDSHILFLTDDIIFMPKAIEKAVNALLYRYPDSDGVVGFNIVNMLEKQKVPYAYMLVGKKFFNERLDRTLFFEGYQHFYADMELGLLASRLERFYFCQEAGLVHFHPCTGIAADETHSSGRSDKWQHDYKLFKDRRCGQVGLL